MRRRPAGPLRPFVTSVGEEIAAPARFQKPFSVPGETGRAVVASRSPAVLHCRRGPSPAGLRDAAPPHGEVNVDAPLQPRLSRRRFLASLGLAAAGGAAAVVAVAEIGSQVGRAQPAPSGSSFGPLDAATPPASPQPSADYSGGCRNHYRSRPDLTPPASWSRSRPARWRRALSARRRTAAGTTGLPSSRTTASWSGFGRTAGRRSPTSTSSSSPVNLRWPGGRASSTVESVPATFVVTDPPTARSPGSGPATGAAPTSTSSR